ncbi:hypothetical protein DNAM5_236 [Bacillus phage Vinny]|uniref:HNH nuclease domain-containing protein n=1 Tax=Bacillus phage Vinny TaxID=1805955 RepID=A0A143FIF3_9CAUD|nr:hypothetical protein DNAM5_236 [Bacillus phage Vinny]
MKKWINLNTIVENGANYSVSSDGEVRNDKTGRILKQGVARGYNIVVLFNNCRGKTLTVHKLVALAFIPNPLNKPQVNHKDGNKLNNSVNNLEWVTKSENQRHAIITGLVNPKKGEAHHSAILSEDNVIEIKKRLVKKEKGVEIAKDFGVNKAVISSIKTGRAWGHIEVEGFIPTYSKSPRRVSE